VGGSMTGGGIGIRSAPGQDGSTIDNQIASPDQMAAHGTPDGDQPVLRGLAQLLRQASHLLEMGQSRPWPEELYALTGERQMDATAILDYFAPLKKWLDEQNKGMKVGV